MGEKVTWSIESRTILKGVFDYLFENYGEQYAQRYLDGVYRNTDALADHPTKGRPADKPGQRRWQLNAHHYVVYEITDDGINIISMLSYRLRQ
jgi:plasmid stabilization system protein ParE